MNTVKATQTPGADRSGDRQLTGNLGTFSLIFMVIAAAAPLTVIGGTVPISFTIGNGLGIPAMFLIATGVLLLFAVGLLALSIRLPQAGAFFSFIAHGLGRKPGLAGAYLAILCYSTIQAVVFILLGNTISSTFAAAGAPNIPYWLFALIGIAAVGILGYRHIELSSKVLFVALGSELLIGIVLVIAVLVIGGPEGVSFSSFSISEIFSGSPGIGLMFAIAGFIGFESAVIFRNEVRDPNRSIPRATYAAVLIIGLYYALLSWIQIIAIGPSKILAAAGADPAGLLGQVVDIFLGPVGSMVTVILMITSMFAAALSLHNILARYFYNLGNTGLLPKSLGAVHPKHHSPHRAAVLQVSVAAVIIIVIAVAGFNPDQMVSWLAGMGTIAITLLMAATCIAAIVYLRRYKASINMWKRLIAPALGFAGLTFSVVLIVAYFPTLVGDVDSEGNQFWGAASIATLCLVALAPIIGWVQAVRVKHRSPEVYTNITERIETDG